MTETQPESLFSTSSRPFLILWFGQAVSLIGTGMSRFGLTFFAWDISHQATAVTLAGISHAIPGILFGAFAGTLVDHWNRKWVLIASDMTAAIVTLGLLVLQVSGALDLWHVYLASLIIGFSDAFQYPAYASSITLMVPKSQFTRSSSMITMAQYFSVIVAPAFAGILIASIGLEGVLAVDLISFLFAMVTIISIKIPQPQTQTDESEQKMSLVQRTLFGFRYIFARESLFALAIIGLLWNFTESFGYPLIAPFILARTGGNEALLGTVLSIMGLGGVIGAIVTTIWGGTKRKIRGLLVGAMLTGLLGDMLLGIGNNLLIWIIAAFCIECFIPLAIGSHNALWQSKVPPDLQGRIFGARAVVSEFAGVAILAIVGPLADFVFEPAMMQDGGLAPLFSWLIVPGKGAGMGLMLFFAGLALALISILGYFIRPLRNIEDLLPDAIK